MNIRFLRTLRFRSIPPGNNRGSRPAAVAADSRWSAIRPEPHSRWQSDRRRLGWSRSLGAL